MIIVEITGYGNNAHRNQTGNFKIVPEGWAVVPEGLETPGFPFGNIVVEEIDGVMTVIQWTECPCPEPENVLKLSNSIDLSSYYAFCADVNSNSIDCAFGKNNEDKILNLGLQLAMYSWFCGDSKTNYPFAELCKCCKLTDIENNEAAFNELWENNTLRTLYVGGEVTVPEIKRRQFPSNRIMGRSQYTLQAMANSQIQQAQISITEEDITFGYIWHELQSDVPYGTYAEFYFNDVLIGKWTEPFVAGKKLKLSDLGINSPGTYTLRMENNSSKSYYANLNIFHTTLE